MMGERTVMQSALFHEFNLERHVPADHLIRSIAPSLISPAFVSTFGPSTARWSGPRLTRNC